MVHRLAFMLLAFSSLLSAQVRPARVRVSEGVMQGLLVKNTAPAYPPRAREARIQGAVITQVTISKAGDVENVQILSGDPILAPAAMEAIKQWKYRPYLLNGEPWDVETTVRVKFTLAGNSWAAGTAGDHPGGIPPGEPGGIVDAADARDPQSLPPRRVRVSAPVEEKLSLKKVPPKYPENARDQRIQGTVLMQVVVDKVGDVAKIELISGHPALAPAAIEAVKQWKYKPYLLNGEPVAVDTQVQVNFTLSN